MVIKKNSFYGNVAWIIGGKIVQSLITLVIGALTARYLGTIGLGSINYIYSFIALFMSVATLGLDNITIKAIIDDRENVGQTLGTIIGMKLMAATISAVCIDIIVYFTNPGDTTIFICAVLQSALLIFQAFESINYWYQSLLKSKVTVIVTLCSFILTNIYKIVLLVLGKSIIWFSFSYTLDYIIMAILLITVYIVNKNQKFSFSFKKAKKLFKQSYSFIFSGVCVALYGQVDKIMIKEILDVSQVGLYQPALSIANMWVFVLSAIIASASPIIMETKKINQIDYEKKMSQLYSAIIWIGIAASIVISLLAKYIVLLLYGNEFLQAQEPLRIVVWYTIFAYLGVAQNIWLICENKQKYVPLLAGLGAVTNIILNYFLIPVWGINGAAIASLASQIMANFIASSIFKPTRHNTYLMLRAVAFWKYFNLREIWQRIKAKLSQKPIVNQEETVPDLMAEIQIDKAKNDINTDIPILPQSTTHSDDNLPEKDDNLSEKDEPEKKD